MLDVLHLGNRVANFANPNEIEYNKIEKLIYNIFIYSLIFRPPVVDYQHYLNHLMVTC